MLRFCLPALFAVLLLSCLSEPDCIVTASNEVKIAIKWPSGDSARVIIFDSILVSGTASLFYVTDTVATVVLPVQPDASQTTFRFFYENQEDSMRVTYSRNMRVISPSCGAFNYYQDLAVPMHSFMEVKVINHQLTTGDASNLNIRF